MHHSAKNELFTGLAILVVVLGTLNCAKKVPGRAAFAAPVLVEAAATMDVPLELRQIGSVEAINSVAVTARVGGQLLKVDFTEGENVSKDKLLFQIDPAPFRAALSQAQANLARDMAALSNANADVARYAGLVEKDYVTKQAYDAAVSSAAEAKAMVEADSAMVQNARLNLDYCTIRSPIEGRTGPVLVKEGNLVVANAPSPLVTINQISPINVQFTVPESSLGEVRARKREASLRVWACIPPDSARMFYGTLTFVDNQVDPATGTLLLKATFENRDRTLWPGQFVRTGLVLATLHNATVVPAAAIQSSQEGDYVYIVAPGDTAVFRPVVKGPSFDRWVAIEKGIATGERVVTDGQFAIRQGSKVTVRSTVASTAANDK